MIILDTHVWLWLVDDPERVSATVREAVAEDVAGVSVISCWEVAMLHVRGRITLNREPLAWVRGALAGGGIGQLPLDGETAVAAALLNRRGFPGDPADRMIFSTAVTAGARLATKDQAMRTFDPVLTLW